MARARRIPDSPEKLEARLGYHFRNPAVLAQALTHRSHRGQNKREASLLDNERLEFVGDTVVGFLVSDALYSLFPTLSEGKLSRIKANLVNARNLHQVAKRLELGRYLRLGPGEEKSGGRQKRAILANAVEAVAAALYRDGGLEPARRFVEEFLLKDLQNNNVEPWARPDYKSALQEYLQGRRLPPARYQTVSSRGPDHRKTFTIELWVGDRYLARGEGPSKKTAEQQAARRALKELPGEGGPESG